MKYLLDVNVLVALAYCEHSLHRAASKWFRQAASKDAEFFTCSITELGFVRVSVQAKIQESIDSAKKALADLKSSSPRPFVLVADKLGAENLPSKMSGPASLTDTHLVGLAKSVGARLVTLDQRIVGAEAIAS